MDLLSQITHNQSPIIRGFGIGVDNEFMKVDARRLDAPKIVYANSKIVTPAKGVWAGENMQFLMPNTGVQYSILCTNVRTRRNELEEFAKMVRIRKPNHLHRIICFI